MGKCCIISGCLSGRKANADIKKVALFKAPKNVEMLRKWSAALSKELKQTSYVCELHFNTNDVIRTDRTVLKDGSIYIYEYEKVHLKKNAVPQLNNNIDKNEDIKPLLDDNVGPDIPYKMNNTIIGDNIQNLIDIQIPDKDINKTISTSAQNSINSNILNRTNNTIVDEPVNEIIGTNTQSSIDTNISDSINTIITDDNLVAINENQEFSLDTLEKILEAQPLRKNWCWAMIKNSFISFSYINSKLELVCHVKIDINLKATITNAKTNILIDMDVDISSIDSVWQLLCSLENNFFCSGTGYDDKKCAPICTGILLPNETYKKKMLEYRCKSCRKLRRFIQIQKKKTPDYKGRWIRVKHRLMLERKKLNRVIKQTETLKHVLLILKNHGAEIEEEIADLPPLQQKKVS